MPDLPQEMPHRNRGLPVVQSHVLQAMSNDLHASGAFYAAQLTRFKCEHCRKPAAFLVPVMDYQSVRRKKVCSACSEKLFLRGWVYTGEPI
jgi:hypothetical protein